MEWYQVVLGVIVGLLILTILVVLHELGHAVVARRNGVDVEEFGIGFPPRAWSKKLKNGILFSVNWLPIGGFVKLKGENDAATEKGTYGAAKFWPKTKILLAGVFVNLIVAMVIFTILSWTGMPKITENQFEMPDTRETSSATIVSFVAQETPAASAGLEAGDEVLTVNGAALTSPDELNRITADNHGKEITVEYKRGAETLTSTILLRDTNDGGKGYLGVATAQSTTLHSTWSAPIVGVITTFQFVGVTVDGLWDLLTSFVGGLVGLATHNPAAQAELDSAASGVAGPVGILGTIFPSAMMAGVTQLVFITGIISLTLAIMNALPIPGLDGGRWFLTAIFKMIRKPLTEEIEGRINAIGMLCLFALIILVTVLDVTKLGK